MTDWRADLPYCRIQNLVERDIAGLRDPVNIFEKFNKAAPENDVPVMAENQGSAVQLCV